MKITLGEIYKSDEERRDFYEALHFAVYYPASWDTGQEGSYYIDLEEHFPGEHLDLVLEANDYEGLVKDLFAKTDFERRIYEDIAFNIDDFIEYEIDLISELQEAEDIEECKISEYELDKDVLRKELADWHEWYSEEFLPSLEGKSK